MFYVKICARIQFLSDGYQKKNLIIQIIQRELVAFPCQSGQTVLIVKYLGCKKPCEYKIKVFKTGLNDGTVPVPDSCFGEPRFVSNGGD